MSQSHCMALPLSAPRLSLRANFSWALLGNVVYSACQWAMLMVLAKICPAESVGLFALSLAVTAPALMLTNLELRAVQATDSQHQHAFSEYLGLRLLGTGCAFAILCAVALLVGRGGQATAVILVVAGAKAVESISDVIYGAFQAHESLDRVAKSMLLKGPLSLFAFALGVWLSRDVLIGAVGLLCSWTLVLVAFDLPCAAGLLGGRDKVRPKLGGPSSVRLLRVAFPLGMVMLLGSLTFNVPRYFIEHVLGARQLGIYAALSSVVVAGATVVGALGQSASPRLAHHFAGGDRSGFVQLVRRLLGIGALLGVAGVLVAVLLGERLLLLFFTPEYAAHSRLFVAVVAVMGLGYLATFVGYSSTAARQFVPQSRLAVAVLATTAVLSFWLVPRWGMFGATGAVGAGLLVQLLGAAAICRRALALLPRGVSA